MKRLRNWFIGDYLAKTDDVFERSKIELLYHYSLAFFLLGALFYVDLFIRWQPVHIIITTVAVIGLGAIPFVLKYAHNLRLASIIYIAQQIIVSCLNILISKGKQDMSGGFWISLFILFAFFLFGRKWGIIIIVSMIMISGVAGGLSQNINITAETYDNMPEVALLPLTLILIVVWMFIKTRENAEKQIHNQKILLEDKNKEVTDSINYAQRIQRAILPSHRLIDSLLPSSFVVYLPKDIVSGDFYWIDKKDDKVFFAVADCTGHGVPGAMMSVICQNALNRVVNEFDITKPSEILDKLSLLVEESFSKSGSDVRDGMDITLCSLNFKSLMLEYSGANNPLYIISNNEINEIKATKQPIGRHESRIPFKNHEIKLNKNDCVYLFSDGIADQFGGPQGKKFKYKRLKEILLADCTKSPSEQKNSLITSFSAWKGNNEQIDDVCLMGIKL